VTFGGFFRANFFRDIAFFLQNCGFWFAGVGDCLIAVANPEQKQRKAQPQDCFQHF
jgi:hypothetical protein